MEAPIWFYMVLLSSGSLDMLHHLHLDLDSDEIKIVKPDSRRRSWLMSTRDWHSPWMNRIGREYTRMHQPGWIYLRTLPLSVVPVVGAADQSWSLPATSTYRFWWLEGHGSEVELHSVEEPSKHLQAQVTWMARPRYQKARQDLI